MKKLFFTLCMTFVFGTSIAQEVKTYSVYDTNQSGDLSVSDVTEVVDNVKGNTTATSTRQYVTAENLQTILQSINDQLTDIRLSSGSGGNIIPPAYMGYAPNYTDILGNPSFEVTSVAGHWDINNTSIIPAEKNENNPNGLVCLWIITSEQILGIKEIGSYDLDNIFVREIVYQNHKYKVYVIGPVSGNDLTFDIYVQSNKIENCTTAIPQYLGFTDDLDDFIGNELFKVQTIAGDWSSHNAPRKYNINNDAIIWFLIATTEDISSLISFCNISSDCNQYYIENKSYDGNTYKIYALGPISWSNKGSSFCRISLK